MISVKAIITVLLYMITFCTSGSLLKSNYRFFYKIRVESKEKQLLAVNVLVYFVLCVVMIVKAVHVVVMGVM